jgi:hypothetical protein
MEHALKEHIIDVESCSVSSHKLSTYSLSQHSMQFVMVIESMTYPTSTFDHCFVVRKLSDWLQYQIDGMSKAWLPHNPILLTYQPTRLLIIWSIVSHELHYMSLTELNDHFSDLLQKNTCIHISISHKGSNKERHRRIIVTRNRSSHPGCGWCSQPICGKNITPLQYTMKFMMLIPIRPVHESHIRVIPCTCQSSLNF